MALTSAPFSVSYDPGSPFSFAFAAAARSAKIFRTSSSFGSLIELRLARAHLLEHLAVDQLRDREARVLDRQPDDRNHVRDDQHDVLRHLRPRHRAHPAEERTHQDAAQPEEDAQLERDADQARRHQPHAVDLRHHVGEGAQDRAQDADEARDVAAVARTEEVRDRELAELAQVRREEQRHEAVAAGPPHDEREAEIPRQVQRAGHADERGRAHPVGAGRHAVEERGDPPPGDVVLGDVRGAADDADPGVQADGGEQERVADPDLRQPQLLEDRQDDEEDDEADGVEGVRLLQELEELRLRLGFHGHGQSPSSTSYSLSSRFM